MLANQEGDWDKTKEYMEAIFAERERVRDIRSAPQSQQEDPLVTEWKSNNSWYGRDEELTAMANNIADNNKNASWKTVLELIDSKIALHLQRQEGNGNGQYKAKYRVPDVSSGRSPSRSEESYDLSGRADRRDIESIAERMERELGVKGMTKEKYIKSILRQEKRNAR